MTKDDFKIKTTSLLSTKVVYADSYYQFVIDNALFEYNASMNIIKAFYEDEDEDDIIEILVSINETKTIIRCGKEKIIVPVAIVEELNQQMRDNVIRQLVYRTKSRNDVHIDKEVEVIDQDNVYKLKYNNVELFGVECCEGLNLNELLGNNNLKIQTMLRLMCNNDYCFNTIKFAKI